MVDNADLNRELAPIQQPVIPFSIEENQLIENLIKVELGTSELIPVPLNVMHTLIHVRTTDLNIYLGGVWSQEPIALKNLDCVNSLLL